jgi:hypothetical protein
VGDFRGAEVYTLEGRRLGRIKEISSGYFTALKRGIVTDEEFKVPMSAISAVENHGNTMIVRLSLKEEQVKHGREFASERPNSEFASGAAESELKIPAEKQVIRYEATHPVETDSAAKQPPAVSEYLCDMCKEKFGSTSELQKHRASRHKAATGI